MTTSDKPAAGPPEALPVAPSVPPDARVKELLEALRAAPFGTLMQLARVGLEAVENTLGGRQSLSSREAISKCDSALSSLLGASDPAEGK